MVVWSHKEITDSLTYSVNPKMTRRKKTHTHTQIKGGKKEQQLVSNWLCLAVVLIQYKCSFFSFALLVCCLARFRVKSM